MRYMTLKKSLYSEIGVKDAGLYHTSYTEILVRCKSRKFLEHAAVLSIAFFLVLRFLSTAVFEY